MNAFADRVLCWFEKSGRKNLPWQSEPTPYRVWVSEIMLQQTQVATVTPYFERFMKSFPDIRSLADAHSDQVLLHWAGLGYYARARNLHKAARIVVDEFAGVFPAHIDEVMALPGIGRSTAGAILALSRNERHAILDGNVKRVLARFHAIDGWPGIASVSSELWKQAELHTPQAQVAEYTQAMMDLGATVCTRSKPSCASCPLREDCAANRDATQALYPGRRESRMRPLRKTCMLLAECDGALYFEKRPPSGIWGGMWSLPEIGDADTVADWCRQNLAAAPAAQNELPLLRHSFSHYDLDIRPVVVRLQGASSKVSEPDAARWIPIDESNGIGLAAPVRRLVNSLQESGW
ncbi:MAG: A/G-specific adenine glycosylase [Gammaproteobacteria bacterium]|nr:A/G-specific adenine glycosylase [Gammaproteobacteria bacterium]